MLVRVVYSSVQPGLPVQTANGDHRAMTAKRAFAVCNTAMTGWK